MTRQITYEQLLAIDRDLQALRVTAPGLSFLLDNTIKRFYEKAKIELQVMYRRFDEIKTKYVEKDERGNFITIQEEGKAARWKYKEIYHDFRNAVKLVGQEVEQAYNSDANEFFSRTIKIDY